MGSRSGDRTDTMFKSFDLYSYRGIQESPKTICLDSSALGQSSTNTDLHGFHVLMLSCHEFILCVVIP